LEVSSLTSPSNYPSRLSRYTIDINSNSSWQNYCFQYLDRPDTSISFVDIILLFAISTFVNGVYYFDNLGAVAEVTATTPALTSTKSPAHDVSAFPTSGPSIYPDTTRFVGNFDSTDQASYVYSSGIYEIATNLDRSNINQSDFSVRYLCNYSLQYDTIIYETSSISSFGLAEHINGNRKFCADVFSAASQRVILQLEDSNVASPTNYPSGRHSRYIVDLQSSSGWQHYCFQFHDRSDASITHM